MAIYENDILKDVVKYLVNILDNESLSDQAKQRGQQLVDKLSQRNEGLSSTDNFYKSTARPMSQYMDMNKTCSKDFRQKSNSFSCIHQAYEDIGKINQPTYINEGEIQDENDSYYNTNDYCPLNYIRENSHSVSNSGDGGSTISTSIESSQSIESYESFKSDPYPSAITVKYSARIYGTLMKRDKILFVDHSRKYWVAVISSAMYVYNGEKELKPCLVVNLDGYTARETIGGNRNKTWVFEVVCPGKKSYQFIAPTQMEMHAWIENINNSWSKSSSLGIDLLPSHLSSTNECSTLPNRKLPEPPVTKSTPQNNSNNYSYYDKPNPLIRPVPPVEEELYSDINDIPKIEEDNMLLSSLMINNELGDGDAYYNTPSNLPVMLEPDMEDLNQNKRDDNNSEKETYYDILTIQGDRNNNEYDGYFPEKETIYDVITAEECKDGVVTNQASAVWQIVQKLEKINGKNTITFLRHKTHLNNNLIRNSIPMYPSNEYYNSSKMIKNLPNSNVAVNRSQSFLVER